MVGNWLQKARLLAVVLIGLPGWTSVRPRWVVYYSDQAPVEDFRDYGLVVLDSDKHPPLGPLAAAGKTLLGYISLGEIEHQRADFQAVKAEGILAGENPRWPGAYYVDVRDERWRRRVIEQMVPRILASGFQGIFLDTLDSAVELERRDPDKYRGMTSAAAILVKSLRLAFPSTTIMMNRGYGLLPEVAPFIDILLGESVYTTYDSERRIYHLLAADEYHAQVRLLKDAKKSNPKLRICTLDYWDPTDLQGIRRIYRAQRANGFEPYVTTIGLDRILAEPR
jgi:polysaccharide biosynthesis protein PelA